MQQYGGRVFVFGPESPGAEGEVSLQWVRVPSFFFLIYHSIFFILGKSRGGEGGGGKGKGGLKIKKLLRALGKKITYFFCDLPF